MPLQEDRERLGRAEHLEKTTRGVLVAQQSVRPLGVALPQRHEVTKSLIRVRGGGEERHDGIRNPRERRRCAAQLGETESRELGEGDRAAGQSASRFASSSNGVTCER